MWVCFGLVSYSLSLKRRRPLSIYNLQVKTTQPRRYLVRPNQGLIAPGETAQVQILLVEKDVQQLWANFSRLGQASLDHCKDKFLVQSTLVAPSEGVTAGDYERLTSFWTNVHSSSSPHEAEIHHKKFPVRHVGVNAGSASTLPVANTTTNNPMLLAPRSAANATTYSTDTVQLQTELTNLSRKYDELVAFSVNLTAERDILNNTLEQTKRDLNRQLQSAAANDNRNAGGNAGMGGSGGGARKGGGRSIQSLLSTLFLLAVTASSSWLLGCYMHGRGQTYFIQDIPKVGRFLHQHIHPGVPLKPVLVADDDDDDDDDDEDAPHEL
jgi:MSP (Major sperm protein) domain